MAEKHRRIVSFFNDIDDHTSKTPRIDAVETIIYMRELKGLDDIKRNIQHTKEELLEIIS